MPLAILIRDTAHAVVEALELEQKDLLVEVWRLDGSAGPGYAACRQLGGVAAAYYERE